MVKSALYGLQLALATLPLQPAGGLTTLSDIPIMPTMRTTEPPSDPQVRLLTPNDQDSVWDFLKYAAHEDEDVRNVPLLQPYGKEFGMHPGDFGVAAVVGHNKDDDNGNSVQKNSGDGIIILGAAWIRQIHDKGGFCKTRDNLPELAMAVHPTHQGKGIGTLLLKNLLRQLEQQHHQVMDGQETLRGICLSCRTDNTAALRLYNKLGFTEIEGSEISNRAGGTSATMERLFVPSRLRSDATLIRLAIRDDVSTLLELIRKKADFDHSVGGSGENSSTLQVTEQRLLETLFPDDNRLPYAQVVLAEQQQQQDKVVTGFASYHFRYSTFAGRPSLWLDDLFVDREFRNRGIGSALMERLVNEIARDHDCTHVAWTAAKRNDKGLRFYRRLGGRIVDPDENNLHLKVELAAKFQAS